MPWFYSHVHIHTTKMLTLTNEEDDQVFWCSHTVHKGSGTPLPCPHASVVLSLLWADSSVETQGVLRPSCRCSPACLRSLLHTEAQFSVLYAWRSPRWVKRCIDWQVFQGVLDHPKKDQAALIKCFGAAVEFASRICHLCHLMLAISSICVGEQQISWVNWYTATLHYNAILLPLA